MTTIADQPDVELVGEVANQNDFAEAVEQAKSHMRTVVMDEREKHRAQCGFMVGRYPEMRILGLAPV